MSKPTTLLSHINFFFFPKSNKKLEKGAKSNCLKKEPKSTWWYSTFKISCKIPKLILKKYINSYENIWKWIKVRFIFQKWFHPIVLPVSNGSCWRNNSHCVWHFTDPTDDFNRDKHHNGSEIHLCMERIQSWKGKSEE